MRAQSAQPQTQHFSDVTEMVRYDDVIVRNYDYVIGGTAVLFLISSGYTRVKNVE